MIYCSLIFKTLMLANWQENESQRWKGWEWGWRWARGAGWSGSWWWVCFGDPFRQQRPEWLPICFWSRTSTAIPQSFGQGFHGVLQSWHSVRKPCSVSERHGGHSVLADKMVQICIIITRWWRYHHNKLTLLIVFGLLRLLTPPLPHESTFQAFLAKSST